MATMVDQKRCQRATQQYIQASDEPTLAIRSRGAWIAIRDYLRLKRGRLSSRRGNVVIGVTDLNVAILCNSYIVTKSVAKKPDSPQQPLAEEVGKQLVRHEGSNSGPGAPLFKYRPFRIQRYDRPPKGRYDAVVRSKFHIYPCPCDGYLDALEVRYLLPGGRSTHEFWLDYGRMETIQYVRNVYAMGETQRLMPQVLADVDPQAFWSAVLHSKSMVKEIKALSAANDELVVQWRNIYRSYLKTVADFKELVFSPGEAIRLLPDSHGVWNLMNDSIHRKVATRNAKLAIVATFMDKDQQNDGEADRGFPKSQATIEIMDNYKGSDIERAIFELTKAVQTRDEQEIDYAMRMIMTWIENTNTCDKCGKKQKDMKQCSRCRSAYYCCENCQRAAWPTHRKVCKELERETKRSEEGSDDDGTATQVKVKMYNATKVHKHSAANTNPTIFVEGTGLGYIRIIWWPSNEKTANTVGFKAMKNDTIFKTETLASSARTLESVMDGIDDFLVFSNDLSNLDPITRFCLACGPIRDMHVAQNALNDALRQARGSIVSLRMKWVGITALEWAAKKGNMAVVEWLLTDERTKGLLHVGSPVGWAAYVNRVSIARYLVEKGANPSATSEVFWNGRAPLLVAAENGSLDAMKFLVDECGVDIKVKWKGIGVLGHIEVAPEWEEQRGFVAAHRWAKKKLKATTANSKR